MPEVIRGVEALRGNDSFGTLAGPLPLSSPLLSSRLDEPSFYGEPSGKCFQLRARARLTRLRGCLRNRPWKEQKVEQQEEETGRKEKRERERENGGVIDGVASKRV